tara:strand:- start:1046 stop:1777 length:732 start_codon:yes stop_codon:yes gene_type:complete
MLRTGYANIPHAEKSATGGEDSWFITEEVIGVADGVGGMSKMGVDCKMFSNNLCEFCEQGVNARQMVNPERIATYAFSKVSVNGASTLLVVNGENPNKVEYYNIGDSQVGIYRQSRGWIHVSPEQEHDFNQPYQLGRMDTFTADRPDAGITNSIDTQKGDILVVASDGLWDNVYQNVIRDLIDDELKGGYYDEGELALRLAQEAWYSASRHEDTPFSDRAMTHGYSLPGGKPDDITVLVSTII